MLRSIHFSFRLAIGLAALGVFCAPPASGQDFRYQKTLFHWSAGSWEEDEDAVDRIVTDRPHFSEASSLVGLGTVQLETGFTFFRNDDDGVKTLTYSQPEPLLRWGIFAEWFEFRLAYNYLVEDSTPDGGPLSRASGSDDIYIGAKLGLTEQFGILPEMALFPQMRVPSGDPDFTSRSVLPGFNFAYSWMLNDWIELECNTQLNRRLDEVDHYYMEFIQTANIEYDLSERVGAFTEWIMFTPCGAIQAHTEHYLHGGFVYFVTPNIQLDAHVGFGVSQAADDLAFTGVGLSIRF
ncbi:MAG: transporter [Pirellulaceae bacterium]|nr:transporter [Pirellulaceae bacterium]